MLPLLIWCPKPIIFTGKSFVFYYSIVKFFFIHRHLQMLRMNVSLQPTVHIIVSCSHYIDLISFFSFLEKNG